MLIQSGDAHPIVSRSCKRTWGKRYTFGVELETSYGDLTETDCIISNVDKYSDRSIPAYEYVTGILHGDKGILALEKICDVLSKKTLVDDSCSVHYHIGGHGEGYIDSPSFNRIFSINSIKLGTLLER